MLQSSQQTTNHAGGIPTPNDAAIRVLLVDDHPAVRLGLRRLIDDQPDLRLVGEARSAEEAIGLECPSDVAVVDYHLGAGRDGLWLTGRLKGAAAPPRVLIYSAFADGALAVTALIAGADGLLGKDELGQELCRAIRRLARGQHRLPAIVPSITHVMRSRLDPQGQAIFGMLLHGIPADEIAEQLGITVGELQARRSVMLRALKSARASSARPVEARVPLDYQRPKRRRSGWAA